MKQLTLYRGLQVPADDADSIAEAIRSKGFVGDEGAYPVNVPNIEALRGELDALYTKPESVPSNLLHSGPFRGTYAGGAVETAEHYALHHGHPAGKVPLVVEFVAPISNIFVDGRDFLYTAFQLWDRDGVAGSAKQRDLLAALFGNQVLRYFDAAAESDETLRRIALCHLAAFDPEVVVSHHRNRAVISGRYKTRFASAFVVECPVPAVNVVSVQSPGHVPIQTPDVTLDMFLALGAPSGRP
jgi:hypothetical protein